MCSKYWFIRLIRSVPIYNYHNVSATNPTFTKCMYSVVLSFLEAAVCGDVELHRVTPRDVFHLSLECICVFYQETVNQGKDFQTKDS